jgi:1-acyl-sn-glycerol-3-phosphate acyltransferase
VAGLFIFTMLWAFFFLLWGKLMNRRKALIYSNKILRWWSLIWGFLIALRFRRHDWKDEYGQQPMVMVTNHNSYLDTVVSYVNIRAAFRTLAKRELLKLPIMGFIFKTSGIMVDRSSAESRKAELRAYGGRHPAGRIVAHLSGRHPKPHTGTYAAVF